jgi:hypothetical protein
VNFYELSARRSRFRALQLRDDWAFIAAGSQFS